MNQIQRPAGGGGSGLVGSAVERMEAASQATARQLSPVDNPPRQQPFDDITVRQQQVDDNPFPLQPPPRRQRPWDRDAPPPSRTQPTILQVPPRPQHTISQAPPSQQPSDESSPRQQPPDNSPPRQQPFDDSPPSQQPFDDSPVRQQRLDGNSPPQQSAQRQRPWDAGDPLQQSRPRQPMPPALAASKSGSGIGSAISRPSPAPQWPLRLTSVSGRNLTNNGPYQPPPGRGQAPQRPPRPRHVPSMLDASRIQEHTPAFQYRPRPVEYAEQQAELPQRGEYIEDTIPSPAVSPETPVMPALQDAAFYSGGAIPDFPLPLSLGNRRSANLGPPPTSRRGASIYYSNASYVSPIPEESPRQPSHESYASSAAMPTSWETDYPPRQPLGPEASMLAEEESIEESRKSIESIDDGDERGLVRSASIGRKGKPTVVMNKTPERVDPTQKAIPSPIIKSGKTEGFDPAEMKAALASAVAGAAVGLTARPGFKFPQQSSPKNEKTESDGPDSVVGNAGDQLERDGLAGETGVSEASSTSSKTLPKPPTISSTHTPTLSLESRFIRGGRLDSDASGTRRLPKLDMDAIRAAEERGSITSLPELIRRATKLAAMIDKGRRPASRFNNLKDFTSDSDVSWERNGPGNEKPRRSSLSGMLAAFPSPGLATPHRALTPITPPALNPRSKSVWPKDSEGSPRDSDVPRQRKRCCGLPLTGFLLILITLLLIIAAAVVVPVELLVVHKTKTSVAAANTTTGCQANIECGNGGTVVGSGDSCSCICANGFTGSTCSTAGDVGCTTVNITGVNTNLTNVTLGFAIPRLIEQAEKNFSIPLVAEVILSQFNAAGIGCNAENALVTFDGLSVRVGVASSPVTTSASGIATSATIKNRQAYTATGVGTIVSHETAVPTTASRSSSPSSPSVTPSSTSSTSFVVTQKTLDFARVAVLFVLQQQQLNNAIMAQSSIQNFFNSGSNSGFSAASNLSLGNGNTINFNDLSVNIGAGNVGGAGGQRRFRRI